jgi:uncharacterized protein (DUF1501 family)
MTLVTMSEFGRTARQNGTRGHRPWSCKCNVRAGWAGEGGRVYGRWPGLEDERLNEGARPY